MNMTPGLMSNPLVAQQSPLLFQAQQSLPPLYEPPQSIVVQSQWNNNNNNSNPIYSSHQLPLQMSQYYNVFPEVPSTKTSWSFPNGCVTSDIVRFTGTPTPTYPIGSNVHNNNYYKTNTMQPTKRKSLVPDGEEQPHKMFISEEKMAAKMNGMHISPHFVSHTAHLSRVQGESNMDDELPNCPNENSEPQLVICDELKNLSKDMNHIIPEPLIPIERPTTALVLWRPPLSYLNVVKIPPEEEYPHRSSVIITDITDRPDLDNNNINSVDLNSLSNLTVEHSPDEIEVMEM